MIELADVLAENRREKIPAEGSFRQFGTKVPLNWRKYPIPEPPIQRAIGGIGGLGFQPEIGQGGEVV